MSFRSFSIAILLASAIALPSRGALLISEVCFNEVGSDTTGEWIEIYNNGAAAIDLSNYKIGDEETNQGTTATESMYKFPNGASIGPGQVQVVAVSATRFNTVYGFMPTYETGNTEGSIPDLTVYTTWDPDGGQINMANTNDQALILDATDAIIDAASWGTSTFAFNPSIDVTNNLDGQSAERINGNVDTNTAADWQLGPTTSPAATRSTPFSVPIPEPSSLALLIGGILAFVARRQR